MSLLQLIFILLLTQGSLGFTIDSKLNLEPPSSALVLNERGEPVLDSSLSPKIVKAFYEIHFVPKSKPVGSNAVSVQTNDKCPFSSNSELCKYYFIPSKITAVQKVEELIEQSKSTEVPVIQGLVSTKDAERILTEAKDLIQNKTDAVVPLNKGTTEVPIFIGSSDTELLNRPEVPPPFRSFTPSGRRAAQWRDYGWRCLQDPCPWRRPYTQY